MLLSFPRIRIKTSMHSAASFKNTYCFESNCKTDRKTPPKHTKINKIMKLNQLLQDRNKC
jgi:hypothetical protein